MVTPRPNKSSQPNPAVAPRLHVGRLGRQVGEPSRWAKTDAIRVLAQFVFIAILLCGCAQRSEPSFTAGRGDAGQFILRHAIARGGHPIATNNLPAITGSWRYFEDKYGVVIRLSRQDYDIIEDLLRRAFGAPKFGPVETASEGRLGGYRLTPEGGGIQFGWDTDGTHVTVLRPLTKKEFAEKLSGALHEAGGEESQ
jgi:hypothetical protein